MFEHHDALGMHDVDGRDIRCFDNRLSKIKIKKTP